ncbi:hypothetical protein [Natronorubrum sulfidifaciens]|uniref:DUF8009 domain-containing protein n=1 Tax=Natronorubrum sulfidifaciens JCM 14089 TaxID=1230460 RepID=L9WD27_9EURY|nr:hypothetical protein [Natronorubrum sulfidifaciens]ELY47390.1 hypothetical protein C495_03992 [Natronorubrum sulfidifaciens JCM 14089]
MAEDDDPTTIRSLALSPDDAASAYAYTQENPGEAVLRVTPPFHGRMRARLHVYQRDDTELTGAIHIPPESVIASDVIDDYPRLEAALEDATPDETDEIRKRHADAVEKWQARARESILEATTIDTDDGPQLVELKQIG